MALLKITKAWTFSFSICFWGYFFKMVLLECFLLIVALCDTAMVIKLQYHIVSFFIFDTLINSFYSNFTLNTSLQQNDISADFVNNNITATQFCQFVDELVTMKILIHIFHGLIFLLGKESVAFVGLNLYTYFGEVCGTWANDDDSEEGIYNNDPKKLRGHAQYCGKYMFFHLSSFCLYLLW